MQKKLPVWVILILISGLASGCVAYSNLIQARKFTEQSEIYYQRAVKQYQGLIRAGEDLEQSHFQLGKLYYAHGEFKQAIEEFKQTTLPEALKPLAIAYYKSGNYVDALEIFNRQDLADGEYLYYHGLTCEKLNLFDQALVIYQKIKSPEFTTFALDRINVIEKQTETTQIQDINPEVANILANAPPAKNYPQAGALILFCDEKIEITPQGTGISYLHYIIKILNERGKESFSEASIDYDSTFEKVELEYARTIKPDGTVVEVGSRHIRDVSKYLNFPLYSNARIFIISFPEISEGAVVEYKVRIRRNQLINKKDLVIHYSLQDYEPIILANLTIELPKGKTLNLKTLNERYNDFSAQLKPEIKEIDSRLIYHWRFKDIPQIMPESNMPPDVEIDPVILISTFKSWEEVYQWWWQLAKDKISADKAIKEKVKDLIQGVNSEEAQIRAIYNFCAREIRYVAVEYGQAGYEPHAASDIFKNKYGDCKDQAILLVAMLREAGLKGWPVLIGTRDYYNLNEDFPAAIFNHCIAAVLLGDKINFLDPTAETCSFGDLPGGDQGRKVLIFKDDGYEIKDTPLYAASHSFTKHDFKININSDESISVRKSVATGGIYEQGERRWLLYTPPELIREQLQENIQAISIGAKLKDYDIQNLSDLNKPVLLNYTFQGPEYFTAAGKLRIMPQLSGVDTALVSRDKRRYPIDFGIPDTKETKYEFGLPAEFSLKYMPEDVLEDSPWLKFSATYKQEEDKIYFIEKIELKKNTVTQDEYLEFKQFFASLAKKLKQRIVLEKIR